MSRPVNIIVTKFRSLGPDGDLLNYNYFTKIRCLRIESPYIF